jgi:hypothetical protein
MGLFKKATEYVTKAGKKLDKLDQELAERKSKRLQRQAKTLALQNKVERERSKLRKQKKARSDELLSSLGSGGSSWQSSGSYGSGLSNSYDWRPSNSGSLFDNVAKPVKSKPKGRKRRKKSSKGTTIIIKR